MISIVESLRNRFHILHDENSYLREENTNVSNANVALNEELEELHEKMKLNLEDLNNNLSGNHLRVMSRASTKYSSCQSCN